MKKIWSFIEVLLRVLSVLVGASIGFAACFVSLFATDSGTPEAIRTALFIATTGIGLGGLFIIASISPELIEGFVPGSPRVKYLVARIPCYLLGATGAIGFVILKLL